MNSFQKHSIFCAFIIFLITAAGCSKKKEKDEKADFDRSALLINVGNNIILPGYENFSAKVQLMDAKITAFNTNPDATSLSEAQDAFKEAYRAWEKVSVFEFGPAEQELLRMSVNIFPTDTNVIRSNISNGSYNLDAAANFAAKGFPAIDYLLFGTGKTPAEILNMYTNESNTASRKAYLAAVSAQIKSKASYVWTQWSPAGGNYISTFIASTGTETGSSTSLLVNELCKDFEQLKNNRIGIPLGKQSLEVAIPGKVEAFYSGISAELALIQAKTLEDIYLGRSNGNDQIGFDDYLTHLEAQYQGQSLATVIKTQFTATISKLSLIQDPLSSAVQSNPALVNDAYNEIKKNVVLLKTDMASALSVLISYADNDGD